MTEDVLGELYGWDSTIDEVFERAQDDPEFDEDRALEAYEELIHMGGRTDAVDGVLSLAAQLLTKHFFKFPHVHMNVVDVLAALCGPKRPQAVRIHTIRSFLQIVKAPASEGTLSEPCRQRIQACVDELLASETSNVLQRNLQQLKKALDASTGDVTMSTPSARSPAAASTSGRDSKDPAQPQSSTPTSYNDRNSDRRDDYHRDKESSSYRGDDRREDRREDRRVDRREDRREDDREDHRESRRDDRRDSRREDRRDDRREDREHRASTHGNDSGASAPAPVSTSSSSCPPGPYIFIGGVPRNATQEEIYDFLADVDPGISPASVQIKFPVRNQAGYSFVNMSSTRHARDAILFVKSTKYNGRLLIGDFARGPPCSTLRFVERRPGRTMYDDDAVRVLYFNEDDDARRLWSQLCEELHSYGDFDELRPGMIRFRETDAAKAVIRRHHFVLAGREILPVYDHKEQQANDGTRRRHLAHGFALKSGRVVGGDERKDYRRHSRSQSPSRSNGYDDKRGRSRDDRDRDVRIEEHHATTRHRSSERGASDANNRSRRFSHREEPSVGADARSHRDWERDQHDRDRREPERRDLEPPKPRYNREPSPQQRFQPHSHRETHHDRDERSYNRDPEPRRDEFRGRRESPERRRPSEDDRGRRDAERRAPRSRSRSPRAVQDRKAPPPPASPRFLNGRRSQSPQPMRRQERRRSPSPRDRMRDGNDSDTRSRRSSKGDDRSIAEIAREQQERQRQMQLQMQQQRGRHGDHHDARHAHGHPPSSSSRYGAPAHRSRSRSPPPVMERERRRSPVRRDSNSYNNNNQQQQHHHHHNSSGHVSSRYNDRAEPYQAHHQRRRSPSPQRQHSSWAASPDVHRQPSERRDSGDRHRGREDRYRSNDSRRQPRDNYDDRRRHSDSHHRSEMAAPERSPAEQARLRSRTPSPTHQRQPDESPRRRYASRRRRSVSPSPSGDTESSDKHYKRRRVEQEQDGGEPSGAAATEAPAEGEADECLVDYEEEEE